jgi:nucleoside-diphosphate-sugar epimerase
MALVREARARGLNVRATGRSVDTREALQEIGAEFIPLDLEMRGADLGALLAGCDSVIHAAALSASWGQLAAFESANVDVTRRLFDAALSRNIGRFVFVSSPSIFAQFEDRIGIGANSKPNPRPLNHYAATKLIAERIVLNAPSVEMNCCVIRPRALVGDGDRVILPKLTELASRPRMPLPRGGTAKIELTDLRDAAWAICEAEERAADLSGQAINISGGQPHTVRDVAEQLSQTLGKAPRFVAVPLMAAHGLANLLERVAKLRGSQIEPLLTRYTLATLAYSQTFDLTQAKHMLDYTPRHDALATLLDQARMIAHKENTA